MNSLKLKKCIVFGALALVASACGSDSTEANNGANNSVNNGAQTGPISCVDDVCRVSGEITENTVFTADKNWVLTGGVFVGDDKETTTLTIEPGTSIFGDSSSLSFLVIRRHSKLIAEGTKDAPIVFTSSKAEGSRGRGDWGGLVINGLAPLNNCDSGICESEGEGGTGKYGGEDPADSSGVIKYVRVEFAGQLISPDNELNGIAFQGVGSGTEVDFVQVHMNKDDGVEFFGGNVNFKHVYVTGIGDDSLDWTDGWQGKGQFFIAEQYEDSGDNGIEGDNNGDNNERTPRSLPTLSNITIIGAPKGAGSDIGVLLREGTGANISNAIVTGFNEGCLDIDNEETFNNAWDETGMMLTGDLTLADSILYCSGANADAKDFVEDDNDFTPPFTVEAFATTLGNNLVLDPMLDRFTPKTGSPALTTGNPPTDAFFEDVDFIGAVGAEDWTTGWTTSDRN